MTSESFESGASTSHFREEISGEVYRQLFERFTQQVTTIIKPPLSHPTEGINYYRTLLAFPLILTSTALAHWLESQDQGEIGLLVWLFCYWVTSDSMVLAHDHMHGNFTKHKSLNKYLDYSIGLTTGMSLASWQAHHAFRHHNPNADEPIPFLETEATHSPNYPEAFKYTVRSGHKLITQPLIDTRAESKESKSYPDCHGGVVEVNVARSYREQVANLIGCSIMSLAYWPNAVAYLMHIYLLTYNNYTNHMGQKGHEKDGTIADSESQIMIQNHFSLHRVHHHKNVHWSKLPDEALKMLDEGLIKKQHIVGTNDHKSVGVEWVGKLSFFALLQRLFPDKMLPPGTEEKIRQINESLQAILEEKPPT